MAKTYFRFDIPEGLGYSPDWCGECYVPRNPAVLFYNEPQGFGVASCDTPSEELDKNLIPITEEEAEKLASDSINQLTADTRWKPIFFADWLIPEDKEYECNLIRNRWSEQVKALEIPEDETKNKIIRSAVFCPVCHRFVTWLPDNIKAVRINLTCPAGHKVVLNGK